MNIVILKIDLTHEIQNCSENEYPIETAINLVEAQYPNQINEYGIEATKNSSSCLKRSL